MAKKNSPLDGFRKKQEKKKTLSVGNLGEPEFYLHSGSYSFNKLLSGFFAGAYPQGRLVALGGHSSSGKSLVAASAVAEAIKQDWFALVVDSEQALDIKYLQRCGVDTDHDNFIRIGANKISDCSAVVNDFIKMYREDEITAPGVIVVDSLDMLNTDGEVEAIEKEGVLKGDQGQRAKQLKRMVGPWVFSVGELPLIIICTKQVYEEQDPNKKKSQPWVFTSSLEYAFSQIIIVEKLVFKDGSEHKGFTMKATSYKNRFAEEKQVVKIEVPYKNGIDPYAGLLEIGEEYGIIEKKGAWIYFEDKKFQGTAKAEADKEFMNELLQKIIELDDPDRQVHADLSDYETVLDEEDTKSATQRRIEKALEDNDGEDDD